jgi:hypothetical protein
VWRCRGEWGLDIEGKGPQGPGRDTMATFSHEMNPPKRQDSGALVWKGSLLSGRRIGGEANPSVSTVLNM